MSSRFSSKCIACFFFTEYWMQSLQACASGLNSTAGSISCDVPCPAGYDCTTSPGNVTLCAAGTYSNYGEGICRSCPSGKVCPDPSQQPQVSFYWSITVKLLHNSFCDKTYRRPSTVKPCVADTCLTLTPHYYRQFVLSLGKESPSLGKESPYILFKFNPLNTDTLL